MSQKFPEPSFRKLLGVHSLYTLGAVAAGTALITLGCGSDSGTQSSSTDRIVAGVNITELSATPSASEISEVAASWLERDVAVIDIREEAVGKLSDDGTVIVRVLSHLVEGERHVGAVVVPEATVELPVLIYSHFGDDGVSVEGTLFLLPLVIGARLDEYVLAIPSFRSQALTFDGVTHRSEGEPSPWVGEVDDGLAFLNVVLETTPQADPERIVVFGMSGGGSNALLMAIRDSRIDGVIDFFAPTDFFGPFVMEILQDALLGEPQRELPGISFLEQDLVPRLQQGELSLAEMRRELLQRSPLYFVDRLPPVQIHHGTDDDIVPLSQSQRLSDTIAASGSELFEYDGGDHLPFGLTGSKDRAVTFLRGLVGDELVASR
jgi:esterase/lipase